MRASETGQMVKEGWRRRHLRVLAGLLATEMGEMGQITCVHGPVGENLWKLEESSTHTPTGIVHPDFWGRARCCTCGLIAGGAGTAENHSNRVKLY